MSTLKISIGFTIFLLCGLSNIIHAQTTSPFTTSPFDLGKVLRNAAEIQQIQEETRTQQLENDRRERELGYVGQEDTKEVALRFSEAIKYRRYKWDDFDDVVMNPDLKISLDMVALMAESQYAADIAYYLGNHLEESKEISRMQLPWAGKAIFAIEKEIIASLQP